MPTLDLVIASVWIGSLVLFLVAQAFFAWLAYRHAARSARLAARLAAATRQPRLRLMVTAGALDEAPDTDAQPAPRPARLPSAGGER